MVHMIQQMLKSVVHADTNHVDEDGDLPRDGSLLNRSGSMSSQVLPSAGGSGGGGAGAGDELIDRLDRSLNLSPTPQSRRTNSIYVTPFMSTVKAKAATNMDVTETMFATQDVMGAIQGIVELDGDKLVTLTRERPELAEYLALEIQNMKLRRRNA